MIRAVAMAAIVLLSVAALVAQTVPSGTGTVDTTVSISFDEMLTMIDGIAYVRIKDIESPRQPFVTRPLRLIDVVPPSGVDFRVFSRWWEQPPARGDEIITFVTRDREGRYHEYGAGYRLSVRGGHVHHSRTDLPWITDGEGVGIVLNTLRDRLRAARATG